MRKQVGRKRADHSHGEDDAFNTPADTRQNKNKGSTLGGMKEVHLEPPLRRLRGRKQNWALSIKT